LGYLTVKEKSLIYNPQTSFPNNEPTNVELGIKPKSTADAFLLFVQKNETHK